MTGICSAHRHEEPGCRACHATPAMLFGISEEEWDKKVMEAKMTGTITCAACKFQQYNNHPLCVMCNAKLV